jgi:hypothetical protein
MRFMDATYRMDSFGNDGGGGARRWTRLDSGSGAAIVASCVAGWTEDRGLVSGAPFSPLGAAAADVRWRCSFPRRRTHTTEMTSEYHWEERPNVRYRGAAISAHMMKTPRTPHAAATAYSTGHLILAMRTVVQSGACSNYEARPVPPSGL